MPAKPTRFADWWAIRGASYPAALPATGSPGALRAIGFSRHRFAETSRRPHKRPSRPRPTQTEGVLMHGAAVSHGYFMPGLELPSPPSTERRGTTGRWGWPVRMRHLVRRGGVDAWAEAAAECVE